MANTDTKRDILAVIRSLHSHEFAQLPNPALVLDTPESKRSMSLRAKSASTRSLPSPGLYPRMSPIRNTRNTSVPHAIMYSRMPELHENIRRYRPRSQSLGHAPVQKIEKKLPQNRPHEHSGELSITPPRPTPARLLTTPIPVSSPIPSPSPYVPTRSISSSPFEQSPVVLIPGMDTTDSDEARKVLSDAIAHNSMSPQYTTYQPCGRVFMNPDRIYGTIQLDPIVAAITKHPIYQRMDKIYQLGPLRYCNTFADHTRKEHCIGVAHLATILMDSLRIKHAEITDRMALCVIIAALCHDLGHAAYSHAFDVVLEQLTPRSIMRHHECRSMVLVQEIVRSMRADKNPLMDLTDEEVRLIQFFIDQKQFKLLHPDTASPDVFRQKVAPFMQGLEQIVSSQYQIDIDKMDYIARDGLMMRYDLVLRPFESRELLLLSRIVNGRWAFDIKNHSVIKELLERRTTFHRNQYQHPNIGSMSQMLIDAIVLAAPVLKFTEFMDLDTPEKIHEFCAYTDDHLYLMICNSNDRRLVKSIDLFNRIIDQRDLYILQGEVMLIDEQKQSIEELSRSNISYAIIPSDKSDIMKVLPRIQFHQDGQIILLNEIGYKTKRVYKNPCV